MTISVIVDNPRSWFQPYARELVQTLAAFGDAKLLSEAAALPKGNDVAFWLSYEKKVPPQVLAQSRHNIVVHASALPQGKGMSPLTWQILEGKNVIPLSLFEAVEAFDAGDIYLSGAIEFKGVELLDEMQAAVGRTIIEMCRQFLVEYPGIVARARQQSGTESFYRRRKPEDSRLDPNKTIAEQFNLLRVVDNERYPAFFEWKGRKFTVKITAVDDPNA